MSYFKDRKLVLMTGDKQFHWRNIHGEKWYKKMPFFYRDMFRFIIDKSDTGGVFDIDHLLNWQYEQFRDDSKFIEFDEIFDTLNKHRTLLRKLHDVNDKAKKFNGLVLIEDYYCLLCGHGHLDVNFHKSSYEKGIINSYLKHGIDFKTIRGLNTFNLEYKKKKSKAS